MDDIPYDWDVLLARADSDRGYKVKNFKVGEVKRKYYRYLHRRRDRVLSYKGIDPHQIYRRTTEQYQRKMTKEGCAWYCMFDVGVFNRTD